MSLYLQHTLVFVLVGACLTFVARQAFASLRGKRSKLGSCCAKGCEPPKPDNDKPERIVFLPADMLRKRK